MKGQPLEKMRSTLMLLMFVAAQAHFAARAETCPPPPSLAPGQHPTLLSRYVKRPPWSGPGIAVHATRNPPFVRVDDTSNVVISGVDFSLHGGAHLLFVNSPNPTVVNSNFGGTNLTKVVNAIIWADPYSGGLTVRCSTIDAGGDGMPSTLISTRGAGTTTLEYNWLKNFPQHVLEEAQPEGAIGALVYKYNLIEKGGMSLGAHLNFLQFALPTITSLDVEYNTTYQTPQIAGGEGFQTGGMGGSVKKRHSRL